MPDVYRLLPFLALAYGVLWTFAFIRLMLRSDDAFRGRYDKPVWAAALIFVPVFGLLAYMLASPFTSLPDKNREASHTLPAARH